MIAISIVVSTPYYSSDPPHISHKCSKFGGDGFRAEKGEFWRYKWTYRSKWWVRQRSLLCTEREGRKSGSVIAGRVLKVKSVTDKALLRRWGRLNAGTILFAACKSDRQHRKLYSYMVSNCTHLDTSTYRHSVP